MSRSKPSFNKWLASKHKENSPVGDLARYARADPRWPQGDDLRFYDFRRYLEAHATGDVVEVLGDAWLEWEAIEPKSGATIADEVTKGWLADGANVTVSSYIIPANEHRERSLRWMITAQGNEVDEQQIEFSSLVEMLSWFEEQN